MKKNKEQNKEKEMQDFCRAVQEFREARKNAAGNTVENGRAILEEKTDAYKREYSE